MTRRNGLLAALAILAAFALLYVVRAGTFQGPAAVATPIGHSTLAMVKRYQHVLPGLTVAAAERMDRVMGR